MIDWLIIGGVIGFIAFIVWISFKRARNRRDAEDVTLVMPEPKFPEHQYMGIACKDADEVARRVHDYEREQERRERADATMAAVKRGNRPSNEDIALLYAYYDHDSVQQAMVGGMWCSVAQALNEVTQELRALQSMQPTIELTEQQIVTLEKIG